MDVKVLGPLEAWQNGISIMPTAQKPRQVLALLAFCAGRVVPLSALVDELWDNEEPPRSAIQVVQTYILRLRQRIDNARVPGDDGAGKRILLTRPGGYLLDIAPEDVDAHRFQRLATAGERAMETGDHQAASDLLGSALDSWRGPVLVDMQVGAQLSVEVEWLEQSRLGVLASRVEADMGLGRHRQLLGELAELTARYPLHEKLCEQYMTVLYECGLKWRALEIFQRLRQRLVDDLGIGPSRHVQQVHHAILNADRAVSAAHL
jgi:DNA-binding SARP family transcriptional activator